MLRHIRESLKPDGRLVLLEYRAEDPSVPIRPEHKMTVAQVKTELEPEGFRLRQSSRISAPPAHPHPQKERRPLMSLASPAILVRDLRKSTD